MNLMCSTTKWFAGLIVCLGVAIGGSPAAHAQRKIGPTGAGTEPSCEDRLKAECGGSGSCTVKDGKVTKVTCAGKKPQKAPTKN